MIFRGALLEIQNRLAWITRDSKNYYRFGENDFLPNEMIRVVNSSVTARACITKLSQFTQGNGFADPAIGASFANKNQNCNSALSDLSQIVAYFKCSSYRVMFNNGGEPAAFIPVPTQYIRRRGSSVFIYNDHMGENGRRNVNDRYLQEYNPEEKPQDRIKRVAAQIKNYGEQYGDIVYHFKKGIGLNHSAYPVPDYYAGLADIESDAGISQLELSNIKLGWSPSVIISGPPVDKVTKDDQGKTAWDYLGETLKGFIGPDGKKIIYLSGATEEVLPKVTTINVAEMLDATDTATDRVGRKVCRLMGVPPVLVGFETAGKLGDVQELENTMQLFKMTIIESQDLIKESLRIVWPNKNWDISPLTLWEQPKVTPNPAPNAPGTV